MAGTDLTQREAAARAGLISAVTQEIELDLTQGEETFASATVIRFTATEPGAATFVDLVDAKVRAIVLNGQALDPDGVYSGGRITLAGLAARNELRVVADCAYSRSCAGLHRMTDPADGRVYLYTHFQVPYARRVFASFDQPDLKARFDLTVITPEGWQVMSASPVPEPAPGAEGNLTWRFAPTPPLSTYVMSVIAGEYQVTRGSGDVTPDGEVIPVAVACRRSLAGYLDADDLVRTVRQGLDYYPAAFGRPYPFAKFDLAFVPEIKVAAMENAACVTVNEMYIFRSKATSARYERRAGTILHELAHMWFGDLVTMTWWNDLWLSESFATYMACRCLTEATNWTGAWTMFTNVEKSWAYEQDELPTTHPIAAEIADEQDVQINFDGITYNKGACVIKQLASWTGEDSFYAGVGRYLDRHEWGNAALPDLLSALAGVSGRDLSSWRAQWLESAGANTLRPEFSLDADGTFTSFAVLQEAPAEHQVLRAHRIAIGLYDRIDGGLTRTGRVETDVTGARTDVPALAGQRQPDLVLLNDDDLTYATIRFDHRSMATLTGHIGEFSHPLQRALCWFAAWDMVRNAELTARDYVGLVLSGLTRESDIGVVEVQQRQVRTAVTSFADPRWRPEGLRCLAAAWHEHLLAARPGSDLQLSWIRALALVAGPGEHLDLIASLLDGRAQIDGLAVDTDLRWMLLTVLVTHGVASQAEIDAELAEDRTAAGQRHAAEARAAQPEAAAKADAWESIMTHEDVPSPVRSALIAGFCAVPDDHRDLLRPYADRYFAELDGIWAARGPEIAGSIVTGLYQALPAEQETVAATDAFLSAGSHPPALRRLLLESRDFLVRALRAQRYDRAAARS